MNEIRVIKGKKDVLVNYINKCSIYIYIFFFFYIKILEEV